MSTSNNPTVELFDETIDMTGKLIVAKVTIGDMPPYHAEPREAMEFVTAEWQAAFGEGEPFDCKVEHVAMLQTDFDALPEWAP